MLLNQDQDLLADLSIAICSSYLPLKYVPAIKFDSFEMASQNVGGNRLQRAYLPLAYYEGSLLSKSQGAFN